MAKQRFPQAFTELRKKAEKLLSEKGEKVSHISLKNDIRDLSHELSVYHIELEMQNDELRRSREQLEESRLRYFDLYENAPVGYLTLDEKGLVLDLNLTATHLLGLERTFLLKKPLSPLIAPESQDVFYLHRRQVLRSPDTYTCELMLRRKKGSEPFFHAQLESIAAPSDGAMVIRTVLTDITERKQSEKTLETIHQGRQQKKVEERSAKQAEIVERKRAEERFQALFTSMSEAVLLCELVFDEAGRPMSSSLTLMQPMTTIWASTESRWSASE